MKIRQGFVSNSSSSSFVIVGVKMLKMDTDSPEYEKLEEKYSIEEDEDGWIVGYPICSVSEYGVDIAIESVERSIKKAKEDFPGQDIRLYAGTTYS